MTRSNRKNEHVSLAEHFYSQKNKAFDDIHFVHQALPSIDVDDVSLNVSLFGQNLSSPFFINAMTGGSDWTKTVNEKLAYIARECDLTIATGSISAALKDPDVRDSYQVIREIYPDANLWTNIGAGKTAAEAQQAVDLVQADALQIHLNTLQELIMPEGDRHFSNQLENIAEITRQVDVPVIVKEVGFGMSRETVAELAALGIDAIDISGRGGTNFAAIENYRREKYHETDLQELVNFGQTTLVSLLEAADAAVELPIIASGGIKQPSDIIKSLALGARAVGIAGEILHLALKDVSLAIDTIKNWQAELKLWHTLLGAKTPSELTTKDLIVYGETRDWCEARHIPWKNYANRQ